MPTPDPSVLPSIVATSATLFTSNWTTILTAVVALLGIVALPSIVAKGGLKAALGALRGVFHTSKG